MMLPRCSGGRAVSYESNCRRILQFPINPRDSSGSPFEGMAGKERPQNQQHDDRVGVEAFASAASGIVFAMNRAEAFHKRL